MYGHTYSKTTDPPGKVANPIKMDEIFGRSSKAVRRAANTIKLAGRPAEAKEA